MGTHQVRANATNEFAFPRYCNTGEVAEPVKELEGWIYPSPNSAIEHTLKNVCTTFRNYREQ